MACNLNSVLKTANNCKENPAGVSNYCMIVPFADAIADDADNGLIDEVEIDETANRYIIYASDGTSTTSQNASTTLKGYKVEFKNQTGQVTSTDNGSGMGNTVTGTGRVEIGVDEMAVLSRTLSNLDGNFLCFFPTGVKKDVDNVPLKEWLVIGNPTGDISWSRTSDTGTERTSDHGTTFTVSCNFQVYDTVKWYGEIDQIDA